MAATGNGADNKVNIDDILELLDWNRSSEEQSQGRTLAQEVKCLNVFLQPRLPYGIRVWDNCAKILVEKTDQELSPYLMELLVWLQDLNWPGAWTILERLQNYQKDLSYEIAFRTCLKCAKALEDETWESNLQLVAEK